jgi:hypothetical protein
MNLLGSIQEVKLREHWKNEATDFTPWLSQEENLQKLSDVIHMDLEFQSSEEAIDGGRADILCLDSLTGKNVIIENQLTKTDADHLGRIMSYAAALDAYTVIWIASEFDEQYRAAIDWLNSISDEEHNFFGIEIKLIKIGDSLAAPMFNLVVKPNGWSKSIKSNATKDVKLTDIKIAQQNYWNGFNEYMQKHPSKWFKTQKGLPQHWTNVTLGKSGVYLSCQVNSVKKVIGVVMIIASKSYYDQLVGYEADFNNHIDGEVVWDRLDGKKESHISIFNSYDFEDETTRSEQYQWLRTICEQFAEYFRSKVKGLK